MKIVVTGSIAHDYIMQVNDQFSNYILPDQIAKLNVSFVVSSMTKSVGGTATNIAYNLGLLGLKDETIMLGSVGKDFVVEESLSQYINFDNILRVEDDLTAGAYLITDSTHNQIIPFYPGAMGKSSQQSIKDIKEEISYAITSPNDKFAIIKFLQECKENTIKCFFDPGQTTSIFTKEELIQCFDYADFLICNDYEFELLMKITGMTKDAILGNFEKAVITLGKDGLDFFHDTPTPVHLDVVKTENVIDPTGAGDTLRAGILAGLYRGNSRADALRLGLLVSTYCIQKVGTLNHSFTVQEIKDRYKNLFGSDILL